MHSFEQPSRDLWAVKQRNADLYREAEQYRLATPRITATGQVERPASRLSQLLGLARKIGPQQSFVAPVAIRTYESPCSEPCPDCAPC